MQIILLESMQNLGELGDTVRVKPGYARNYLIPTGKAVVANDGNRAEFEARREELERQQAEVRAAAQTRADALEDVVITITRKAGDEGKLFGSVGNADVADAITASGVEVHRSEVRMPEDSLRQTGEYPIGVHLYAGIDASVTLIVDAEE